MAKYPQSVRFCGACGTHLETGIRPRMVNDTLVGTLVGNRFVVIEKIGQGGMGVVYRAEQTGIWRPVALKVLHPRYSRDKMVQERFRIEAATASKLSHPNTITIYDFGFTDDGGLYIAMEMLDGRNLDQMIVKNGALDWQRACQIGVQICGSLQEAHDFNILHRDLKPENIMLIKRGNQDDVVKVLDFGIAKLMTKDGDSSFPALTAEKELFGTPEYMSPEQIRGDVLDHRSDIYALGVILYRMVSAAQPFNAPTPIAILTRHLTETPPPAKAPEGHRKLPAELVVLIASCLAKGRDDRPPSMQAVAETLRRIFGEGAGSPVSRTRSERPVFVEPQKSDSSGVSLPADTLDASLADDNYEEDRPTTPDEEDVTAPVLHESFSPHAVAPLDKTVLSPPPSDSAKVHNKPPPLPAAMENTVPESPMGVAGLREATLRELKNKMTKQRDFPAMSGSVLELSNKAGRDDTSARKLSNVILRDYALTSKLLRLVNSPFYSQYRGRVMTVSRAVVILGFEQVRQISMGLMMFDRIERTDPKQAAVLKDEALFSLTSGLAAKRLAAMSGDVDPEAALICGMFHRLGKYIAFYYFPKKGKEIRRLIQVSRLDDDAAALKVLGISFSELGKWMIKEWQLPEQFGEAMDRLPSGPIGKPRSPSEKLKQVVGLADELCNLSVRGLKGNRTTDLKTLARRFEKTAPLSTEQLEEIVSNTADEVQDWAKVLSVSLKDSRFIGRMFNWSGIAEVPDLPDERFSESPVSVAPSGSLSEIPGGEPDALVEKKQIFEQSIEEINLAMAGPYDLNGIILMALETVYRGLGLSRVIFFLHDVKTEIMIARSGFGEGVEDLLAKFRFQPARGRDYFNQAAFLGKDVILNDMSLPRVQERIPAWYRRVTEADAMILYPVMLRNVAVGMYYGDLLNPNVRINRGLLVYVDRLRNLTARAVREKRFI